MVNYIRFLYQLKPERPGQEHGLCNSVCSQLPASKGWFDAELHEIWLHRPLSLEPYIPLISIRFSKTFATEVQYQSNLLTPYCAEDLGLNPALPIVAIAKAQIFLLITGVRNHDWYKT